MTWSVVTRELESANRQLRAAGVETQTRYRSDGGVEFRYLVPLRDGRKCAISAGVRPTVTVGAGSFGKKLKRKLKRVAKSKAFKRFAKVAQFLVPGAAAPAMLIGAVGAVKKAKAAARKAPPPRAAPKRAAPPPRAAAKPKPKPAPKRAAAPARAKPAPKRAPPPKRAAAPKPAPKRVAPAPKPKPVLVAPPPTVEEEAMAVEVMPDGTPVPEEALDAAPEAAEEEAEQEADAGESDEGEPAEDGDEVGALFQRSDALLRAAGVQVESKWERGRMHYRYLIPLSDGRRVAFSSIVEPRIEIGAGRIAKKIKKGLKKVAKSKAFGKVLKGLGKLASIVPIPGASALGKGLDFAAKAQKTLQKKKKKPAPKQLPAGKPASLALRQAASTAKKPAPKVKTTRPFAAQAGTLVQLPSGRKAIVTFVD